MSNLYRFGVSLEKDLIKEFDRHILEKSYKNRSEAIRDLIRAELVKKQWQGNNEVAGAITMSYDHHKRDLVNKLVDIQHDFQKTIISTQHIHIDHFNCLEILAVKGKAKDVEKLASMLKSQIGVKHVALSMSTTGTELK
ncbi:MAG TPA: nickel-responsive transcriptional regulator NikR [Fibrobacteres bacterium]|jgi:CopG family transcriptional regulator, nickel-responsive regulator|nr:nickel-responsive transcriptional regulator NikR [Fibrobacterota bacterium]